MRGRPGGHDGTSAPSRREPGPRAHCRPARTETRLFFLLLLLHFAGSGAAQPPGAAGKVGSPVFWAPVSPPGAAPIPGASPLSLSLPARRSAVGPQNVRTPPVPTPAGGRRAGGRRRKKKRAKQSLKAKSSRRWALSKRYFRKGGWFQTQRHRFALCLRPETRECVCAAGLLLLLGP